MGRRPCTAHASRAKHPRICAIGTGEDGKYQRRCALRRDGCTRHIIGAVIEANLVHAPGFVKILCQQQGVFYATSRNQDREGACVLRRASDTFPHGLGFCLLHKA